MTPGEAIRTYGSRFDCISCHREATPQRPLRFATPDTCEDCYFDDGDD